MLPVLNMSATMARQGGPVQLEKSDMCLALTKAKMAKEGFLWATIEETQYMIKKPRGKVREEKMQGDEFPGRRKVKAARQRHPAMIDQNPLDSASLAKTGPQRIRRHPGGTKQCMHVHQNWCHLHSERHLCHLETVRELNIPQSKVCYPDMCIYILLFPTLSYSILIQMGRIASAIKVLIQICWMMKELPLVRTLSAAR